MTLLQADDVEIVYTPAGGRPVPAVQGVSLSIPAGQFVGLVGESGCGKSTLGYALTHTLRPPAHQTRGRVEFDGQDISVLDDRAMRLLRRGGIALVMQSGMNALSPVRRIDAHFADVMRTGGWSRGHAWRPAALRLLAKVHLDPDLMGRYPHELSGGMRQRVAIALALSLEPRLIVFDEPTTALDVIVQAAVIETIRELQQAEGFTAVLISHDLGLVVDTTDRVVVMYAGRIVEDQASHQILRSPRHPYTRALLGCYADPRADVVELHGIPGSPPDLSEPVTGCPYAPRCFYAEDRCRQQAPVLRPVGGAEVSCHRADEIDSLPVPEIPGLRSAAGRTT
ncbi:MAG: ABC transporter ATP-binding protein [Actinomycetes bacterium]